MNYKLLALDIDGTIVPEGTDDVSSFTRKAIQEATNKIHVSLVSARSKNLQDKMIDALGCPPAYHVIENGAKIIDPEGNILRDLYIPHNEVQKILDVTEPYFSEVGFCIDHHWENNIATPEDQHVNGLSFTCLDFESGYLMEQAIRQLPQNYNIFVSRHWSDHDLASVLVFHEEANKGKGIEVLQKKLGVKKEETIAVGDAWFDHPMFEYAGLKVAMANGEDSLKQLADVIAPDVRKDGLVEIINKYVLL